MRALAPLHAGSSALLAAHGGCARPSLPPCAVDFTALSWTLPSRNAPLIEVWRTLYVTTCHGHVSLSLASALCAWLPTALPGYTLLPWLCSHCPLHLRLWGQHPLSWASTSVLPGCRRLSVILAPLCLSGCPRPLPDCLASHSISGKPSSHIPDFHTTELHPACPAPTGVKGTFA